MSAPLEMVLAQYADAAASGDANVARWLVAYPQHARELAGFAADLACYSDLGDACMEEPDSDDAPFMAALARFTPPQPCAPIASLCHEAQRSGLSPNELAARLALDVSVLAKLDKKLIRPATLPKLLVALVAEALQRSVDEVAAYLRTPLAPATAVRALSFRAPSAPAVTKGETFADAIRSAPEMLDEARNAWLTETDLLG
ncbi:MAG: hypothetical protein NT029_01175 [Armatimonadetes bacterium]|nr:hypothetical protein [Armatimonadota bacterium]